MAHSVPPPPAPVRRLPAAAAAHRGRRRRRSLSADVVVVERGSRASRPPARCGRRAIRWCVLEARDRVGGRTWTKQVRACPWISAASGSGPGRRGSPRSRRPSACPLPDVQHRPERVPAAGRAQDLFGRDPAGRDPRRSGTSPWHWWRSTEMAEEVPLAAPWKAPRAREWDGQTLETWKLANMKTEEGRLLLDLGIEAVFAGEPRDVSLLHVLFYIHSAGSFENLINTAGGAQESRFVGGSQRCPAGGEARSDRGWCSAPPCGGSSSGAGESPWSRTTSWCTADTAWSRRRRRWPAASTITQSFPAARPAHPAHAMGSVLKSTRSTTSPFWRDDGRTGQATSDTGPVKITYDNSPPTGRAGVLLGFIEGEEAREWGRASARPAQGGGARPVRKWFGGAPRSPQRLHGAELDGGGVEPRLLRRAGLRPACCSATAPRSRAPVGPDPLGRDRDLHRVVRVHGRRGALRRARGRRGGRAALAGHECAAGFAQLGRRPASVIEARSRMRASNSSSAFLPTIAWQATPPWRARVATSPTTLS